MKKHKTEFRIFTIADWIPEQNYLRKRNQEGWKFVRVGYPGIYHFEQCEPEDVIYQLDYNEQGLKEKETYVQMFTDCGWEYLMDFGGYSYFRKPASKENKEDSIFCDDDSRLDMIRRVFVGRYIPLFIILLLCIIPNIIGPLTEQRKDFPILLVLFFILMILYLGIAAKFLYQYLQVKKHLGS